MNSPIATRSGFQRRSIFVLRSVSRRMSSQCDENVNSTETSTEDAKRNPVPSRRVAFSSPPEPSPVDPRSWGTPLHSPQELRHDPAADACASAVLWLRLFLSSRTETSWQQSPSGSVSFRISSTLGPLTSTVLFLDFRETPPRTTENQWRAESPILIGQGLAGVALRMLRHHSVEAPADIVRDLENAHFDAVTSTFQMLQSTGPVLEQMRSRGIPFLVSKGPGIARAYEPASERTFSDLDILVRPRDFTSTLRLLEQVGYRERQETSQPWPSHRRLGREATNLRTIDGGSLDLHHRISPWNWSTGLSFDALAARARDVVIGGVTLPLVSIEHNLLIAALHVVSDQSQPGRSYRIWRDLLVLSRMSMPNLAAKLAADSDMSGWLEWILMCLPRGDKTNGCPV